MDNDEPVIESIIICDGAIIEKDTGKITLIGCFNNLASPQIPVAHPGITVAVSISNFTTRKVTLNLTVRIEDAKTGHVLVSGGAHIEAVLPPELDPRNTTLDLPIRLPAVVFPQPCLYCANVLIDNESLRKRMLPVILAPPKPIQNESPKE